MPSLFRLIWVRKGYPSKITDRVDEALMGGPIKIDSVQNIFTLQIYVMHGTIMSLALIQVNANINGLHLQLDHIRDPTLRPLDELSTDHFTQGLLKYLKGTGESIWTYEDYDNTSGDGFNLSTQRYRSKKS
ncbi:hypothetical protein F5I97DRAFT_1832721 [Phlebopus sp. FC_14]|nr:hypothetical protein F5I97DRAFT_1832721 [Phlebopus sp. FC_14]